MIDIIIPCYNAHKTLEKTLCSIALQNIKDQLNIYIVDDCSDKNYNEICDKYSKLLNIKLLKLNENMGPGHAREYGLYNSNGKYVMFVDSDDILYDCYSLHDLHKQIENDNWDIVLGGVYDSRISAYIGITDCDLHGKIFRRSLIDKYDIHFVNTKTVCNDDTMFYYMCQICTDKICVMDLPTYVYQTNSASLTSNKSYWIKNIEAFSNNGCLFIDFINKNKIDMHKSSYMICNMLMIMYHEYNCYANTKNKKKLINWIKPFYKKANPFLKQWNEDDWNNLYREFRFAKMPKISFNEFIDLLEK